MWFVTLHKPYKGNADPLMIRGDLVLEISTRRQTRKGVEFDGSVPEGDEFGTWVLIDRMGWTPCTETAAEVAEALLQAEIAYLHRLQEAKVQ